MKRGLRSALAGIGLAVIASFSIVGGLQYLLSTKTTTVLSAVATIRRGHFISCLTEHQRLHIALLEVVTGTGSATTAERRYEVFVSRLNIVNNGSYRKMFKGRSFYENAMADLGGFVAETDATAGTFHGFSSIALADLLYQMPALREPIQTMLLGINAEIAGDAAKRWSEINETQRITTLATVNSGSTQRHLRGTCGMVYRAKQPVPPRIAAIDQNAGSRQAGCGGGQPREDRVPGQHEPRDPHAAERGAGHGRRADGHAA